MEKEDILSAALEHVQTLGWSSDALARGCSDLGLSVASVGMFPRGGGELVEHFLIQCNEELDQKLGALGEKKASAEERFVQSDEEITEARMTEKLAAAVQMRLQMIVPYIDTWPQAMAVAAMPPNSMHTLQIHAVLMDTIWGHVGDQAQSVEWYSRRAALGAVYAATELHLLTDKSEGHQATWDFLGGRLQEASIVGKQLSNLSRNSSVIQGLVSSTVQAARAAMERNTTR